MMEESGVVLGEAEKALAALESEGKTAVLVARGNRLVGVLGIADPPKAEAAQVVEALHDWD